LILFWFLLSTVIPTGAFSRSRNAQRRNLRFTPGGENKLATGE
jgi:hypothetical protein